jgi:hypothetical protein
MDRELRVIRAPFHAVKAANADMKVEDIGPAERLAVGRVVSKAAMAIVL